MLFGKSSVEEPLTRSEVRDLLENALADANLKGKRVLVIIPDSTRSGPIGVFFRIFNDLLSGEAARLDYLIALGTHRPMSRGEIRRHLDVTAEEMERHYGDVRVFNHRWSDTSTFENLGVIPAREIGELSQGLLSTDVPVTLNKMILEYDYLVTCGPVFPHAVVGFSGGNKYFFPGISGPEIIDITHWLGALITTSEVIGRKDTPVRSMIDRATDFIDRPKLCLSYVVRDAGLAGVFIGTPERAWSKAADLSARVNVVEVERTYQRVLAVMPRMYDDLWTAAKGMYKLEPVIADGGEVIIYAPHVDRISYTHGDVISEVGYHVRGFFSEQWDRFKHYPWSVLAHSTHLRGRGTYEKGIERPRIRVTLATGIPRELCEKINLGYRDPTRIDLCDWHDRESEGILFVPEAGEKLYRVRE
jgi:nickel-dependent lactate racemase